MLNEQIEKRSKIGSIESIIYIAYWLSAGTSSIDDLYKCVQGNYQVKISEIHPVLCLFKAMSLIDIKENCIECKNPLKINGLKQERFLRWFIPEYISYILYNDVVDLDKISYSVSHSKFMLSSTAISPRKYACYRNLLIELGVIDYCSNGCYLVNNLFDESLQKFRKQIITEEKLLDNLDKQRKQGQDGEKFVVEYERKRITVPELKNKIRRISIIDVSAGFDIVSFDSDRSVDLDRFIEVKTYIGKPHFHWSMNEIEKAKLIGDAYFLYLVDYHKIGNPEYEPQCIQNPAKTIIYDNNWRKTPDSYLIECLDI